MCRATGEELDLHCGARNLFSNNVQKRPSTPEHCVLASVGSTTSICVCTRLPACCLCACRVSRAKALAPTPTEDQEASPPEPPERDESLSLIPGDPPPLAKGMTSAAEGTWDFSVRDSLTRVFSDQAGSR